MFAVEVRDLLKVYPNAGDFFSFLRPGGKRGGITALDRVSLAVEEGEVLGLVGENGAGKTTLINVLCTLVIPTAGTARVGGRDVMREPAEVRKAIGLVASNERSFYWRLTGRQNLAFFSELYRIPPGTFASWSGELMEALDIAQYADRRFDSLSTGIRQRFAFARAMLHRPRIIFMDEPTKGLDPVAAAELLQVIRDRIIGSWRPTIIITSHNLKEIEDLCNRVAIMSRGGVVYCDSIGNLRRGAALGVTYRLAIRGGWQGSLAALTRIEGVLGAREEEIQGTKWVEVRMAKEGGLVTELLRSILAGGGELVHCSEVADSVQEVLTRILAASHGGPRC